ncbi:MAG: nitrate reductase cytochrome c-type subunit [Sulfuricella sp.]|nr:nitrate reductase cytochrome c-type subunit [Gammaproteobacteria bacterium]
MATRNKLSITLAAMALSTLFFASVATADEELRPLRKNQMTEEDQAPAMLEYQGKAPGAQQRITRNFAKQPPLIPHSIEGFRIDSQVNICLACHDRPSYKAAKAPKIGDSHYRDREGKELKHISMGRYNCNQCHVPQADAQPLVGNTFQAVKMK